MSKLQAKGPNAVQKARLVHPHTVSFGSTVVEPSVITRVAIQSPTPWPGVRLFQRGASWGSRNRALEIRMDDQPSRLGGRASLKTSDGGVAVGNGPNVAQRAGVVTLCPAISLMTKRAESHRWERRGLRGVFSLGSGSSTPALQGLAMPFEGSTWLIDGHVGHVTGYGVHRGTAPPSFWRPDRQGSSSRSFVRKTENRLRRVGNRRMKNTRYRSSCGGRSGVDLRGHVTRRLLIGYKGA